MGRKATTRRSFTREDILRAMRNTRSNSSAAKFLRTNLTTYRKYAKSYVDNKTGKTLYELHSNPSGKGISPYKQIKDEPQLIDIFRGKVPVHKVDIKQYKQRLLREGYLEHNCNRCGYSEERLSDRKIPLLLNYIDGKRTNLDIKNLELLCYNCYFISIGDIFLEKEVSSLEDVSVQVKESTLSDNLELDDAAIEQLKEAGLWEEDLDSPDEFLDRL